MGPGRQRGRPAWRVRARQAVSAGALGRRHAFVIRPAPALSALHSHSRHTTLPCFTPATCLSHNRVWNERSPCSRNTPTPCCRSSAAHHLLSQPCTPAAAPIRCWTPSGRRWVTCPTIGRSFLGARRAGLAPPRRRPRRSVLVLVLVPPSPGRWARAEASTPLSSTTTTSSSSSTATTAGHRRAWCRPAAGFRPSR